MRTATQTLKDHLATGFFTVADLLVITAGSTTYRLTNAPVAITYAGQTYTPAVFKVGRIRQSMELEVDKLEVELGNPTLGGKKLSLLVATGALDGAVVTVSKLFMQPNGTPIEHVLLFSGDLSDVEPSATECRLTVRSVLAPLEAESQPLRVIQPACPWNVYDDRCGLDEANFTTSHTLLAGATTTVITPTPATPVTKPGWVTFTSGANSGVTRLIRSNAAGELTLAVPLPFTSSEADELTVTVGCPKTRLACLNTFNNLNRYGGFPDVPRNHG